MILAINGAAAAENDLSPCVVEFDRCVTNRDCCTNLECVTGDWEYTTDSTCLSQWSRDIDAAIKSMTLDEKTNLLLFFYQTITAEDREGKEEKSKEDISQIGYKYRHVFPKLVSKLGRKYGEHSVADIAANFQQGSHHPVDVGQEL